MSDDLDFSAWEAPPPPDGLADAVVARMGGTAVGLAMPDADAPRRRRWVIAASAAAVLVAAGGVWAIVRNREPAPAPNGAVIADRAQHVELGGVSADLDRGADIHWHRTRDGLDIDQRAGTAVWRVGSDERIVIGAAVASIEAAGASLRVEVPMNPISKTDARVVGASALTAAAVAMVTVVVYEGQVKVSSSGQTVVVQPGTTYTVRLPGPPAPEPVVGTATIASGASKVAVLGLEGWNGDSVPHDLDAALRARVKLGGGGFVLAPASDKELADEKLLHDCANEEPACMAAIGSELGADVVIYGAIASQRAGYFVVAKRFDVAHQQIERTVTELLPAGEARGVDLDDHAKRIYDALIGAAPVTHPVPPPPTPTCDVDALIAAGNARMTKGDFAGALATYEQAAACKGDDRTYKLAFMAACNAKNVTKASQFWQDLEPKSQEQVLQMCIRVGITRDQLDPSACDAEVLMSKGIEAEGTGNHATALERFEEGIRCQPSTRLYQMAFMASCNAQSVSKASYYWQKLSKDQQQKLKQMCVRFGITEQMLDGGPAAPPPDRATGQGQARIDCVPKATILFDGNEVGMTPVVVNAAPGKHKVTFVIGQDRFTYPVVVKAGATATLSKDLR